MDQAGSQWDAPRLTPGQLTHAATRPVRTKKGEIYFCVCSTFVSKKWLVLILYRKVCWLWLKDVLSCCFDQWKLSKILTIDYNPMTGVVEGTLTPKAGVQM